MVLSISIRKTGAISQTGSLYNKTKPKSTKQSEDPESTRVSNLITKRGYGNVNDAFYCTNPIS